MRGMARIRLTRQEIQRIQQERDFRCEEDDSTVNSGKFSDLGDSDLEVDALSDDGENRDEKLNEDIAYEVIGELLQGGAIDRGVFFDDGLEAEFGVI